MLIDSVSSFGSFSQNGYSRFWPGSPSSVLQLRTMLPSRECLVAAMETRVWDSCLSALTGKWVWIRTLKVDCVIDGIRHSISPGGWTLWRSRSKHRYDLFPSPRARRLTYFLNSSRISWATFFACAIPPPWFKTLHWLTSRVVFVAVYYKNIWMAQNFPFVSLHSHLTAEHWRQLPTAFSTLVLWKRNTVRSNTYSQCQLWSRPHTPRWTRPTLLFQHLDSLLVDFKFGKFAKRW